MASKGVQDRIFLAAPTIWAAFAYSEFVFEAGRRTYPDLEAKFYELTAEERQARPRYLSLRQFMRLNSDELCRVRDRMVAADRALDRERRALAEERRRRDEQVKTTYRRVIWLRDQFEDRVGKRRTTDRLNVQGDTPRDPDRLLQVARRAAETVLNEEVFLPEPMRGTVIARQVVGRNLADECDVLEASLKAITLKQAGVNGAISVREERIDTFDDYRAKLGRFLEALLVLIGMPTLAEMVRPELEGTGRRGRPSKEKDLFPDLVEAALALDPGAGLTIEEIRDLVPRRPVEYRRREDVPAAAEVWDELRREAEEFRARRSPEPEADEDVPRRLEPEALGGPGAVDRLKGWLAGVGRAILGRRE